MQVNTGVLLFEVNQEPRPTQLPSPGSPLDNRAYDQQTREGSELGRAAGVFRRCPEMIDILLLPRFIFLEVSQMGLLDQ